MVMDYIQNYICEDQVREHDHGPIAEATDERSGNQFGHETLAHKNVCCGQGDDVGSHEAFITEQFSQALLNKSTNYACAPAQRDDQDPFAKACHERDFSFQRRSWLDKGVHRAGRCHWWYRYYGELQHHRPLHPWRRVRHHHSHKGAERHDPLPQPVWSPPPWRTGYLDLSDHCLQHRDRNPSRLPQPGAVGQLRRVLGPDERRRAMDRGQGRHPGTGQQGQQSMEKGQERSMASGVCRRYKAEVSHLQPLPEACDRALGR